MLILHLVRPALMLLGLAAFGAGIIYFGPMRHEPAAPGGAPPATAPAETAAPPTNAPPTNAPPGASEAAKPPASGEAAKDIAREAAKPAPGSPSAKPAPQGSEPTAQTPRPPVAAPPSAAPRTAQPSAAGPPADVAPSSQTPAFDVVRVEPSGEAVIAGRAAPGATVELLRDGKPHDRVVSDPSGLFAMTPPPLPPGDHQLTLRFSAPDGKQAMSKETVTVAIAPSRKQQPLVALTAPDRPTVVLSEPGQVEQKPAPARPQVAARPAPTAPGPFRQEAARPSPAPPVLVETVETEEGGKLYVGGRATPGATVRLYLNNSYLASGSAAPEGRLSFTIGGGVTPGDYKVRLDEVDPATGSVKSRAEVPFNVPTAVATAPPSSPAPTSPSVQAQRPAPPAPASRSVQAERPASPAPGAPLVQAERPPARTPASPPAPADRPGWPAPASPSTQAPAAQSLPAPQQRQAEIGLPSAVLVPEVKTAIVSRGDSLWRISRRVYGQGVRYTVIYGANQAQIGNPDLIYPGQTFVLPGEQP